jgi:hypothetical protein
MLVPMRRKNKKKLLKQQPLERSGKTALHCRGKKSARPVQELQKNQVTRDPRPGLRKNQLPPESPPNKNHQILQKAYLFTPQGRISYLLNMRSRQQV